MRRTLHWVAAGIFTLLAVVKLAALMLNLPLLNLYNSVFPFLQNKALYGVVILYDLLCAFICVRCGGRTKADVAIFVFIATMLWYKASFHLTGGTGYGCGCLGILTLMFDMTKSQETAISYLILIVLAFCTAPGLLDLRHYRLQKSSVLVALGLFLTAAVAPAGAETLTVKGRYEYGRYNADTGVRFTNDIGGMAQSGEFDFKAMVTSVGWKISVTNLTDTKLWTELVYDGTNLFAIHPCTAPFVEEEKAKQDAHLVSVSQDPRYLPSVSDWAHTFIPWLVYGVNPSSLKADENGIISIPLPWETSRRKPFAYGWEWKMKTAPGGRFLEACEVVRNSRLDTSRAQEFLRQEMNYPENISLKNMYIESLEFRKQVANGFVDTEYKTTGWFESEGLKVPKMAEMVRRLNNYEFPFFRATLTAGTLERIAEDIPLLEPPARTSYVEDYRYKRSNSSRIFRYGEYTVAANGEWKGADDSALLAEAEYHLKHGPRYNYYDYSYKHILVWVVGGLIFMLPLVLMLIKRKKQQKQKE